MNNIHTNYYHYNNKLALAENVSIEPKYLKMPQSRQNKGYRCPCGFSQIRCLVYILGLGFSLWQTAVCLEKYLQFVRSTQVSMKKSTNTYLPALGIYVVIISGLCSYNTTYFFVPVVCPSFGFGFNTQFLESLNNSDEDYKKGSWIGNYSLDPLDSEIKMIYKNATLDVEKGINNNYIVN